MSRARVGCHLGCLGCSVPLLALLAVLVLALSACGGGPNPAACKTAMRAEFAAAVTSGKQGTEPAACRGLSNAELRKLLAEILTGN